MNHGLGTQEKIMNEAVDSSTITKSNESEYVKYLEIQIFVMNRKIEKICKRSGISQIEILKIDQEIDQGIAICEGKFKGLDIFKAFDAEISEIYARLTRKLEVSTAKVLRTQTLLNPLIEKYKKSLKILEKKCFEYESKIPEQIKDCFQIIEMQENKLRLLQTPLISPEILTKNKKKVQSAVSLEILQKKYEDLLYTNLQLKSNILKVEGELTKQRIIEESVEKLTEKCELLEKVNKELISKKTEESDDSLNLDCTNIKDVIEIQELRAALVSLGERYEQEKEIILKDCEESRQDIETQMFRLRNEKAYIEVKLRDNEKLLTDIVREKERQDSIIMNLKREIERNKEKYFEYPTKDKSRGNNEDLFISNSADFDLTESVDKCGLHAQNEVFDQEEINHISDEILKNKILITEEKSNKNIVLGLLKMCIEIKRFLSEETDEKESSSNLNELVTDVIYKYKQKISELERINSENNKKINVLEVEKYEKTKKIEKLTKYDMLGILTEPSPRSYNNSAEVSVYMKKQILLDKNKIIEKKNEIHLHKEQIAFLKQNVRDLQAELDKATKIDMHHLKVIWLSLARDIPLFSPNFEEILEVFMKILGFTSKDIITLNRERKAKKSKFKLGIFG